ncbi:hypothetical protein Bca101_096776 [Brassica carinata]
MRSDGDAEIVKEVEKIYKGLTEKEEELADRDKFNQTLLLRERRTNSLSAELQRYRDAYGGQLPNGEAAAGAGDVPIPPGAGQNPPPPPAAPAVVHAPGPNYWDMMRHMKNMQMEFFNGKADAIAADNWRRQLERNFVSARCPPEFRRDLAVHHLKDDALVWWEEVVERAHGIRLTWDDFLEAFNWKYFPLEAMDAMESKFQDIRQGTRNVRDYGDGCPETCFPLRP